MKPLFCALALFTMLAPARAQDVATPPTTTEPKTQVAPLPAVKLDSGITVTPVILPYSELENMMGVQMWRFLIKPSFANQKIYSRVELRTKDKPTRYLGVGNIPNSSNISNDLEFTLGILPFSDFSLTFSNKWRVSTHHRVIAQGLTIDETGSASDSDNPIKGLENPTSSIPHGYDDRYGEVKTNGEVSLMTFQSGPADKRVNSELVLIFVSEPKTK